MAATNGHSPQQTSVFIAQPDHGEHKTSDNLLSPTPSTAAKRQRTFTYRSGNKKPVIILTACILLALIVLVVVLVVTLNRGQQNVSDPPPDRLLSFCTGTNESTYVVIGVTYDLHLRCSNNVSVTEGCSENSPTSWKLFDGTTADGQRALELASIPDLNYSSVLVSPLMMLPRPACDLRLSHVLATPSTTYYVTSKNSTQIATAVFNGCAYGQIKSGVMAAAREPFRIVVVSRSSVAIGNAALKFSITAHQCATFESIARTPVKTQYPSFARVPATEINTCSLEIVNQTSVACDWWNVEGLDGGSFVRGDSHQCVEVGVGVLTGNTHFLRFEAAGLKSRALLVSPVVESGADHVIFSFWYLLQCELLTVRAYVVPYAGNDTNVDVWSVDPSQLVLELKDKKPERKWTYVKTDLRPPKAYKWFQVVIDGSGTVNGSCVDHYCNSIDNADSRQPDVPLIALDDLVLESVKPQCKAGQTNGSVNLDCNFEKPDGSPTMCHWSTVAADAPPIVLQSDPFYGHEWKPVNAPKGPDSNSHGPISKHFQERGHVLLFDATGIQQSKFWSPLLISNQNCSCNMSMLYLLRGEYAPRLKLNFIYESQQPGRAGPDKRLPRQTKWSTHGHQSEDWIPETIVLNLDAGRPFVIEMNVDKPGDSQADVAIDDIFFHGCDLSLVT